MVARDRLATLYSTSTTGWQQLATYAVPAALPAMPPPHRFGAPAPVVDGAYVAGDHTESGSIQGALASGRRAAAAVIASTA